MDMPGTVNVYSRAVRRQVAYFYCVPDRFTVKQLETYFSELVDTHSWATVRVDRNVLLIRELAITKKLMSPARTDHQKKSCLLTGTLPINLLQDQLPI